MRSKISEAFNVDPDSANFLGVFLGAATPSYEDFERLPRWRGGMRVAVVGPDSALSRQILFGLLGSVEGLEGSSFDYRPVSIVEANVIVYTGLGRAAAARRQELEALFDGFDKNPATFDQGWRHLLSALLGPNTLGGRTEIQNRAHITPDTRVSLHQDDYYGSRCRSVVLIDSGQIIGAVIESSPMADRDNTVLDINYGVPLTYCLWEAGFHMLGALGYDNDFTEYDPHNIATLIMLSTVMDGVLIKVDGIGGMCPAPTSLGVQVMEILYGGVGR